MAGYRPEVGAWALVVCLGLGGTGCDEDNGDTTADAGDDHRMGSDAAGLDAGIAEMNDASPSPDGGGADAAALTDPCGDACGAYEYCVSDGRCLEGYWGCETPTELFPDVFMRLAGTRDGAFHTPASCNAAASRTSNAYRFQPVVDGTAKVTATGDGIPVTVTAYDSVDCDAAAELTCAQREVTIRVKGGESYYFVVTSSSRFGQSFSLGLEFTEASDTCAPLCRSPGCGSDYCGGACGFCADNEECAEGTCREPCPSGTHRCGDQCLPDDSVASCGARCTPCPVKDNVTARCEAGQCVPRCDDPDAKLCGTGCTPCPTVGVLTTACGARGCIAIDCAPGFRNCDGGCCLSVPGDWITEPYDDGATLEDMAVDSEGRVHTITIAQTPVPDLNYEIRFVRGIGVTSGTGLSLGTWAFFTSRLAIGPDLEPHITFQIDEDAVANRLYFRRGEDAPVVLAESALNFDVPGIGRFHSVDVDRAGDTHVAFVDPFRQVIEHVLIQNSGRTVTLVDFAPQARSAELAIGASDEPHVVWHEHGTGALNHAVQVGESWTVSPLPSSARTHGSLALAADTTGRLHVVFQDRTTDSIRYGVRGTNGVWAFEEPHPGSGTVGRHVSIAVDAAGQPHILYSSDDQDVLYAFKTRGAWLLETIGTYTLVGRLVIGVDPDGVPHALYHRAAESLLKARREP